MTWWWRSTVRLMPALDGRMFLQRGAEVAQHAELPQDHRARRVAIEAPDPPVLEQEDIAARRVHPAARGGKDALRQPERPIVRSLQRQFDRHKVTADVD